MSIPKNNLTKLITFVSQIISDGKHTNGHQWKQTIGMFGEDLVPLHKDDTKTFACFKKMRGLGANVEQKLRKQSDNLCPSIYVCMQFTDDVE